MNVKISVFVICVEAIIYLLLCNLHDCTFKFSNLILGSVNINLYGFQIFDAQMRYRFHQKSYNN